MPQSTDDLLNVLALETIGTDRFRGVQPNSTQQRVFGGQVIGQALAAADRTAPDGMTSHSLHAHFLRPGDPSVGIEYEVTRVRDGRSFATRQVTATQHDRPIHTTVVSFHIDETGFDHQDGMPVVGGPDESVAYVDAFEEIAGLPASQWIYDWPMLDVRRATATSAHSAPLERSPAIIHLWMRVRDQLPDDPQLHRQLLGYFSDLTLLSAATIPHNQIGQKLFGEMASLDHAVWFHRPARLDEWLLFVQHSPVARNARGLIRGEFYTADGALVASVMQEALVRPART